MEILANRSLSQLICSRHFGTHQVRAQCFRFYNVLDIQQFQLNKYIDKFVDRKTEPRQIANEVSHEITLFQTYIEDNFFRSCKKAVVPNNFSYVVVPLCALKSDIQTKDRSKKKQKSFNICSFALFSCHEVFVFLHLVTGSSVVTDDCYCINNLLSIWCIFRHGIVQIEPNICPFSVILLLIIRLVLCSSVLQAAVIKEFQTSDFRIQRCLHLDVEGHD